MRGRKPNPTHLKRINGNPSKRPLNGSEPVPEEDLVAAPKWMSDSQLDSWAYPISNAPHGLRHRSC